METTCKQNEIRNINKIDTTYLIIQREEEVYDAVENARETFEEQIFSYPCSEQKDE